MPSSIASSAGGFYIEPIPAFQLSDGPNPNSTPMASALMILLPSPTFNAGEFVTTGNGSGGVWRVSILPMTAGVLGAAVFSTTVPNTSNVLWVALDPAVFPTTSAYRVRVKDDANNICDEWDFRTFTIDSSAGGPSGIQSINDAIRRIAGLLGYRQRVTYSDYLLGKPQTALIDLMDSLDVVIAQYRRTLTLDSANQVLAETSAALDQNNLGA